jgi:protein subunit release factor B
MKKELLFSITKKDFDVQTFRSGGKGGQHQNTSDSGVRIVHRESGAVGESREERSQYANKKTAFLRLIKTQKFKAWHRLKCAELKNKKTINELVDEMMQPEFIRVEIKDEKGRWIDERKRNI